jgi:outer membrane protein
MKAQSANMQQAFGSYLPSINGNMGYSRHLNTNDNDYLNLNAGPNSFNMGATASWLIFDGFGREASFKMAQSNLKSTEYDIENTRDYIIYQVYVSYINIIRNAQVVKIRRENISTGRQELEMIQARYEAGLLPVADVYSKEADLGNRESELIIAENNLAKAKASLLAVMGLDPGKDAEFLESSLPTDITESDIESFYSTTGGKEGAEKSALTNRNDYLALNESLKSSESSVKVARSAYSPRLSGNFNWNWADYDIDTPGQGGDSYAGVTLSVPIYNNFSVNNNIQNAKLGVVQQETAVLKMEQAISKDLQTAFLNLKAAEKMIEVAEKSVKANSQNYNAIKERFDLGSASITDLTLANMQLITSRINKVDAVYSYIAAQKEVLFNMGILK